MIVVSAIVLMAMHCPKKVNVGTVGMSVVVDHLKMILWRIQKTRGMGCSW